MLGIQADAKNSENCYTYANIIFAQFKESQKIHAHVFAILHNLQLYLDILQIFLSALPAQCLEIHMVCLCAY